MDGLKIYNAAGQLQMTSEMACVSFDRKFTINTGSYVDPPGGAPPVAGHWNWQWQYGSGASSTVIWTSPLTGVTDDEIVAISAPSDFVGMFFGSPRLLLCNGTGSSTAVPAGTVTVYIFKIKTWTSGGNFNVYDASGTLIFSPNQSLMKVADVFTTNTLVASSSNPATETYTVPSGTWAAVLSRHRVGQRFEGTTGNSGVSGDMCLDGIKTTSTNIQLNPTIFMPYDTGGPYPDHYAPVVNAMNYGAATTLLAVNVAGL